MARKSVDFALKPYIQQLGKVPDQVIAEKAGVSRAVTVSFRQRLGIPAYNGHRKRSPTETVAPVPAAPQDKPFRGRKSALDQYINLLGKLPDAEIARRAGVTSENVRTYRQRRNIEANWRTDGEPEPSVTNVPTSPPRAPSRAESAPAPAPAPVAVTAASTVSDSAPSEAVSDAVADTSVVTIPGATGDIAFQVTVDLPEGPHPYVVVARDIAHAAQLAMERVERVHNRAIIRSIQRIAIML